MAKTSFKNLNSKPSAKRTTKKTTTKKAASKKAPTRKRATAKAKASKDEERDAPEDTSLIPAGSGEIIPTENSRMTGEFGSEDVILPRLNVVAKTSELVDDGFTPGAIVLSKEMELVLKEEPLEVIVLSMEKKFQEDVPYGTDEQPQVFATKREMHEAGFSTEYGAENYCQPMANFILLVKLPEGLEDEIGLFGHEFNGEFYAMAAFTAAKTAYKTTAKEVVSFATFSRGMGIHATNWTLTSKLKSYGDNSWFSPYLKRAGLLDEDTLEFVESLLPGE